MLTVSLCLKESRQNFATACIHDALHDFGTMIHPRIAQQLEHTDHGSTFWIGSSEDYLRNSRIQNGAGAHRTGFEGHVKRAVCESPAFHGVRGLRNGDHLSVRRRIFQLFALIVGSGDHATLMCNHGADRNFPCRKRLFCLLKGHLHERVVQINQRFF